jgi:ketol-acid reductoisomerase
VIDDEVKRTMEQLLSEIQDGSFARRWVSECDAGGAEFQAMRAAAREHQIERVGAHLRSMMDWLPKDTPTETKQTAASAA